MRFVLRNRAGDPQIHSGFAIDKVAECAPAVGDKWKKERRRGAGGHERVGGGGGGGGGDGGGGGKYFIFLAQPQSSTPETRFIWTSCQ